MIAKLLTKSFLGLVAYMTVIALAVVFSGCYTERTAERDVIKADVRYPSVVSAYCATTRPCEISNGSTEYLPGDTVEGPQVFVYDTVHQLHTKIVYRYIRDTVRSIKFVKNTAEADSARRYAAAKNDENVGLKYEVSRQKDVIAKQRKYLRWFIAGASLMIIALIVWVVLKVKKTVII